MAKANIPQPEYLAARARENIFAEAKPNARKMWLDGAVRRVWFPFDDTIEAVINKLKRKKQHKASITDAHKAVRNAIVRAVSHAAIQHTFEIGTPKGRSGKPLDSRASLGMKDAAAYLRKYGAKAAKLAQALRDFKQEDHGYLNFWPQRRLARRDQSEAREVAAMIEASQQALLSTAQSLDQLANRANEEAARLAGGPGSAKHRWQVEFVISLGFFWRHLTGKDPSHGSRDFVGLVASAYAAAVSEGEEYDWESIVRTACKHVNERPAWDRWDRYEKGYDSPGTESATLRSRFIFPNNGRRVPRGHS
ncbi:MAG: hypothetical protein RO009_18740 [Pseudorhodoplanes sp.]|jgi:hypothetical protein|nr:hypothetical protein [Pseudorhodoplanes sp.]